MARGQTNLEYVLLVIVVGLTVLFVAARFGGAIHEKWCEAALAVQSVKIIGSFVPEEPAGCSVDASAADGAEPLNEVDASPPLPTLEPTWCEVDNKANRSDVFFRFPHGPGVTLETGPDNTCPGSVAVASGVAAFIGRVEHGGQAGTCVVDVIHCAPDEGCSEARIPVAFGPDEPRRVDACP